MASVAARAALEYSRAMVAHHTAARVQARLRRRLYDHITALGPAHFTRARTGDVTVSLVEGVQQLEVYFGQYLPQALRRGADRSCSSPWWPGSTCPWPPSSSSRPSPLSSSRPPGIAPTAWNSLARQQAYAAYAAEFLDSIQGLVTLARAAPWARTLDERGRALFFQRTMWVLGTNTLARGITDAAIALGAGAALARAPCASSRTMALPERSSSC